jgi:hypothetical protein
MLNFCAMDGYNRTVSLRFNRVANHKAKPTAKDFPGKQAAAPSQQTGIGPQRNSSLSLRCLDDLVFCRKPDL